MIPSLRRRSGQSLVLFAVWAVTMFILMGLGIDSGMLYVERRHLQNTSDAACLAAAADLVQGQSAATATTTADTYITNNVNTSALALDVPKLTRTITINGSDVRVSLVGPASTYFMRVGGINTYNVGARTHCDATHGGGVLPIAVVRFQGYDSKLTTRTGAPDTSLPLPQGGSAKGKKGAQYVLDALQKDNSVINQGSTNQTPATMSGCGTPDSPNRNWYDWNGGPHDDPAAHTGSYHDACTAASPAYPGHEVAMAGVGAKPNIGTPSFRGIVVLDARLIGGTWSYFNALFGGVQSLNAWKATVLSYIYSQYPGPDVQIGTGLGLINGNTSGPTMSAMNQRWKVGDTVTTLVYDGTVHTTGGDFQMSLVCQLPGGNKNGKGSTNPNCNNDGTNGGSYIYRTAPPNPIFNSLTTCDINPDYFIADAAALGSPTPPLPPLNNKSAFAGNYYPAIYTVHVASVGAAKTVNLTARISGSNPGSGADFGNTKVRWTLPGGTPSAWQAPSVVQAVGLSANTAADLTLEVIQTTTTTQTCNGKSYSVPVHTYGAQKVQVIGQSTDNLNVHSVYGELGMQDTSAAGFATGDYFFSFASEPVGYLAGPSTLDLPLQFIDATSTATPPAEFTFTTTPAVDCTGVTTTITGLGAGMTASIAPGAAGTPTAGLPTLQLVLDGTTPIGWYTIDVQWNNNPAHSSRYTLYVDDPAGAKAPKWWVNVVCYARFQLTYMNNNGFGGKAVSGCLDPSAAQQQLLSTSRILPWQ